MTPNRWIPLQSLKHLQGIGCPLGNLPPPRINMFKLWLLFGKSFVYIFALTPDQQSARQPHWPSKDNTSDCNRAQA